MQGMPTKSYFLQLWRKFVNNNAIFDKKVNFATFEARLTIFWVSSLTLLKPSIKNWLLGIIFGISS